MKFKKTIFSILSKENVELEYIKDVYKRRLQSEIDSFKDSEDEDNIDTMRAQDVLMLDSISI